MRGTFARTLVNVRPKGPCNTKNTTGVVIYFTITVVIRYLWGFAVKLSQEKEVLQRDPADDTSWRKKKGKHDDGQQDRESPRRKSSSERVSERTSENLRGYIGNED